MGHVERVGHPDDAGLDRVGLAAAAVTDDRVQRLRDHDRALGGVAVDVGEQLAQLALGEEQAVGLVVGAVDRHPHVVQQRAGGDDDLGVALAHRMVRDHRRLQAAPDQEPQDSQGDVEDDPHVDPRVVGHPEPLGVDLGHVPPGVNLGVGVEAVEQRLEPSVAACRGPDAGGGGRPRPGCARARPAPRPPPRRRGFSSGSGMLPSSHAMTGDLRTGPPGAARGEARARVALLGNPSDGFGGKTLGLTIEGMSATVTLGAVEAGEASALIGAAIDRFNRVAGTSVPGSRIAADHDPPGGRPRRLERDRDRHPAGALRGVRAPARRGRARGDGARGRDRGPRDRRRAAGPARPGARGTAVHGLRG